MKPPISYYGGKQRMIDYILPLIPPHRTYIEPFFGGGTVYFAKSKSQNEIINDYDSRVFNFWKVCQNRYSELKELIDSSFFGRDLFDYAGKMMKSDDELIRAWAFWMRINFGFNNKLGGGLKSVKDKYQVTRYESKRDLFNSDLWKRLQGTVIENKDALELIKIFDGPEVFYYFDPPYYQADKGHYYNYYEPDFIMLLDALSNIKGKFLLSCYPGELIEKYISEKRWNVRSFNLKVFATNWNKKPEIHNKRKTELLIYNYHSGDSLF